MQGTKLRFGSFSDRWTSTTIGQILTIKHGKDYKHLPEGDIPVLGTGGKISGVSEALCNWPCVLIGRKGTINKPQYMDVPFWSVDTLFYSKAKDGQSPKFQYYLFQTIDWLKYNEASGVPSLSTATIENIAVNVPSLDEQQKIASFFSTLDEKIRIAECKIDRLELLKKGVAQKIFSRQIRFRKKNESSYPDWIKAPINKAAIVNPRNETTSLPDEFLYIDLESVSKGVLVKENIISKHEAPSRAQRVVKEGDILFQMVRPYQGNNYFVRKSNIARVASTGYAQIRSTKNNSHFIYQSLHQPSFLKKVMGRCTGGAYPAINSSDFSSIELEMPCIEEQNRISQLFEFLDKKIDISRQRLMKLKSLKTNLLQKMFI